MKIPFVLAIVSVATACASALPPSKSGQDLDASLTRFGFDELALPSTAFGPGSLVTSLRGTGFREPLRLAYICDPTFTLDIQPQIDTAASQQLSTALDGNLSLSAQALTNFGLGANANFVNSVSLNFANVRVEQHSFEQLRRIVIGLGPECARILEEFRSQGIARQTLQALRADVEYKVAFKSGASVDLRNQILTAVAGQIGGSISSSGENAVSGQGLYYGVTLAEIN